VLLCCCSSEELSHLRVEMACGRNDVAIEDGVFAMSDYRRFLSDHADGIDDFRCRQAVAFAAERQAWDRAVEFANQLAS
jgi:urea carboxylase